MTEQAPDTPTPANEILKDIPEQPENPDRGPLGDTNKADCYEDCFK